MNTVILSAEEMEQLNQRNPVNEYYGIRGVKRVCMDMALALLAKSDMLSLTVRSRCLMYTSHGAIMSSLRGAKWMERFET